MFSSYAITVMVLHLFNRYGNSLRSPFAVLRMFFYFFHGFPWETSVLTLEGPKPIQLGGLNASTANNLPKELQGKYQPCINQFRHIASTEIFQKQKRAQEVMEVPSSSGATSSTVVSSVGNLSSNPTASSSGRFPIRSCNIQDPVDEANNLGISVSRHNLQVIDKALFYGYNRMEQTVGIVGQMLPMYINSVGSNSHNNNSNVSNCTTNISSTSIATNNTDVSSGRTSPSSSSVVDPQRRGSRRGSQGNSAGTNGSIPSYIFPSVGGAVNHLFPVASSAAQSMDSVTASSTYHSQHQHQLDLPPNGTIGMVMQPAAAPTPSSKFSSCQQQQPAMISVAATSPSVPILHPPGNYHSLGHQQASGSSSSMQMNPPGRGLFVREMFPVTMARYILPSFGGNQRPDLLLHPMQKTVLGGSGKSQEQFKIVNQSCCRNDTDQHFEPDPYDSNVQEIIDALVQLSSIKDVIEAPSSFSITTQEKEDSEKVLSSNFADIVSDDNPQSSSPGQFRNDVANTSFNDTDDHVSVINSHVSQKPGPFLHSARVLTSAIQSKSKKRKDREKEKAKEKHHFKSLEEISELPDLQIHHTVSTLSLEESLEKSGNVNVPKSLNGHTYYSFIIWKVLIVALLLVVLLLGTVSFVTNKTNEAEIFTRIQLGSCNRVAALLRSLCSESYAGESNQNVPSIFTKGHEDGSSSVPRSVGPSCDNTSKYDSLTHLITHWVQLGDTVTFGEFSGVAAVKSDAMLHSTSDQSAFYIWQKDFQYLTTTQVPYFTVMNSRFDDAGHYRCLKMMESTTVLVTETIIRISRTFLYRPFLI